MKNKRIFQSAPHMGGEELDFVHDAFSSNYIAPVGPQIDAFEREFAEMVGRDSSCLYFLVSEHHVQYMFVDSWENNFPGELTTEHHAS